ncbi:MAG: methylmalonyl Co-A mutase-associated GTPase MeaB [Methylibium sp.]|uniref:methylmalonyl Co-A mutase-associated GTPase MeaB n=1 Tax=Methylibium sp. TaxID=2067992 RepID=UPI001827A510|nr:methylmalonyl Co-A mutase-associated GTPase MeaB [Methylibium sp.]MBA3598286.1 methylmalonyl Co-A mutase-associated GTPase MeaB [Methylibium sp.]
MLSLEADRQALLVRVRSGDRRAIARVLTYLDDGAAGSRETAELLASHAGHALVVGITGVPGGGKSTLVNALLGVWLARDLRVAVIAVDPSSPVTGGAVLGDRIRMGEHGAHPNCFIRSLSARGQSGGLSRTARAAVDCFDAAGFDRIIVETVGAGQSETAIASLADTRVVVCPPGLGDGVQAIKAGILEIADVLAVSKGDLPLAEETARDLREMLTLRKALGEDAWAPRVMVVSGAQSKGVSELVAAIEEHAAGAGTGRRLAVKSKATARDASSADRRSADAEHWLALMSSWVQRDGLCSTFGISVTEGGPGRAVVRMTVDRRHMNFNGGCHGGAIFALADTAFGLASNSHGALATGIDAHVTFQVGIRAGETLVARATELSRGHRIGMYRVDVARVEADGRETAVSSFTGTVYIKHRLEEKSGPQA